MRKHPIFDRDFSWIENLEVRGVLERVANLPLEKLKEIDVDPWCRDKWLFHILKGIKKYGIQKKGCIFWDGPVVTERNGKIRAKFKFNYRTIFPSRVGWSLVHETRFPEKLYGLHNCGDHEDPLCVFWDHIYPGTNPKNRQDQSTFRKTPNDWRWHVARIARGTYNSIPIDKRMGVVSQMHRYFMENGFVPRGEILSRPLVSKMVNNTAWTCAGEDASEAIAPELLEKYRVVPRADAANPETKMPERAKKLYVALSCSNILEEKRKVLREFCMSKYGVIHSSLCRIRNQYQGSVETLSPIEAEKIVISQASLEILFEPYPALPGRQFSSSDDIDVIDTDREATAIRQDPGMLSVLGRSAT